MRILVTGGAGFIGSHLTEHLLAKGHEVTVLDRREDGYWHLGARHLREDCCDQGYWQEVKYLPPTEFVYHLASTVGVKNVLANPAECIRNIVESTRAVLSLGIPGMYFSTSEVYGKNTEPLREDSPMILGSAPRWSYAFAKLACEQLALAAGWKVIRPFNVVGPRQSGDYGAVLPTFIKQVLADEPVTIYGDGFQRRTFIDVRDFVRTIDDLRDHNFKILNVGGKRAITINELAVRVGTALGKNIKPVHIPYRKAYGDGFEECPNREIRDSFIKSYQFTLSDTIKEIACHNDSSQTTQPRQRQLA